MVRAFVILEKLTLGREAGRRRAVSGRFEQINMADLELSESLKESGIEEIKTLGTSYIIKHKITPQSPVEGSFEIKIKEDPYETGKSLQRKCGKLLDPLLVQSLIVFITDNWEQIEIKSESKTPNQNRLNQNINFRPLKNGRYLSKNPIINYTRQLMIT